MKYLNDTIFVIFNLNYEMNYFKQMIFFFFFTFTILYNIQYWCAKNLKYMSSFQNMKRKC